MTLAALMCQPPTVLQTPPIPALESPPTFRGGKGVPFVSVAGGFAIGNNFEGELPQVGNTFQWADNFSKVMGAHSLKFGADVRRQRFDQFLYYNINGDFSFQPFGSNNSPGGATGILTISWARPPDTHRERPKAKISAIPACICLPRTVGRSNQI